MTLLVARQCRLLSAPHGAVGALQRLHRPAVAATRRTFVSVGDNDALSEAPLDEAGQKGPGHKRLDLTGYKQHQRKLKKLEAEEQIKQNAQHQKSVTEFSYFLTPKIEDSEIVPVDSAILIPASVTATKPEHFIEKIEPIEASASFSKQNLVVFLVTPSFAPWLLDDRVFVEKALSRLYKNLPELSGPLPKVHAICAVVDRLPEAKAVGGDSGRDAVLGEFRYRARQPPVTETGYEGIAYVVLPAKAEVSAQPKVNGEFGCFDFLAHTHTDFAGRHYDRVRVPLANTVFQTGEPSTLINSVWEWSRNDSRFEIRTRRQRKTAVVNLSAEDPKSGFSLVQSHLHREAPVLSIPLLPLTVPRQVDGHMGNIIRGIVGPDEAKMTASTELEQVVPQYFKSRGEPAQATSAWALVIPKEKALVAIKDTRRLIFNSLGADPAALSSEDYKIWEQKGFESLWQQQPPRWNIMIQEALMRGARLHKVLSGGGGWGKKAGLLSLDPMPVGAPARELPARDDMAGDYDSVDEFSTALRPVVEDGDFIQFFISAVPAQEKDDATAFEWLKCIEETTGGHTWSWEFGVIPSTMDSIPGGSWQHTGQASEEMAVFRGSFGALTEGGLTLMHGRAVDKKTGIAEENLNTTTVDVPFSRWSAVRLHPQKGIETGRVGDFSKKAKALLKNGPTPSNNAGNPS